MPTRIVSGSSPLSRGIPEASNLYHRRVGIIPALAGNTSMSCVSVKRPTDHPRSRGEYYLDYPLSVAIQGSSPLSRGIPRRRIRVRARRRIIPALAGNTSLEGALLDGLKDHPRSRGEYRFLEQTLFYTGGSSPLSRGIRVLCLFCATRIGIIPALAGNTTAIQVRFPASGDHPRSRGEYGL